MRAVIAFVLVLLPAPALAQNMDDPHNNLFVDHSSAGNNGSVRVGNRLGGRNAPADTPAAAPGVLAQPGNSGIHVYQPRSLNDMAKDWAKAHPNELPNRRKPDPQ